MRLIEYESLRLSTILRYPKKKRPKYQSVMESKVDYLNIADRKYFSLIHESDITKIISRNLYDHGILKFDLSKPWFCQISKYIGQYTQVRILCHTQLISDTDTINTFILIGMKENVKYCSYILRWVYHAVLMGTTSKNKHIAISKLSAKFKVFLDNDNKKQDIKDLLLRSANYRDQHLKANFKLETNKSSGIVSPEQHHLRIIYPEIYSQLPEGKFKKYRLIC